jgi:hypothetical protein
MARIIECPVPRYKGSITLPDFLNYQQVVTWEASQRAAKEMFIVGEDGTASGFAPGYGLADIRAAKIPAIIAIVMSWDLENVPKHPTANDIPATPAKSAAKLYEWLTAEISKMYAEEDAEIPNA